MDEVKERANKFLDNKYIRKCQDNSLIKTFFETLILFIYQDISEYENPNLTLKEVFDHILNNEIMLDLPKNIIAKNDDLAVGILVLEDEKNKEKELNKRFERFDTDKEFKFLQNFCEDYLYVFDRFSKRKFLRNSIESIPTIVYAKFFNEFDDNKPQKTPSKRK